MNFFKTFLATLLGIFTSLFLLFLVFIGFVMVSSSEPAPQVDANSVLTINLTGDIPAYVVPSPLEELIDPAATNRISLESLKANLTKAAADDNIQAVWVKTNIVGASWANLETARQYFQDFKESGKLLYFSTDDIGMNEKSYFLATAADGIYSPPNTNFEFDGFVTQMTFYADMLDKIGLKPQVFRVGKYKSAVEPFLQTSSSLESREQMREIMGSAASTFVAAVTERTGKTPDEINTMLNSAPINRINFAVQEGLIDSLAFEDEVEEIIKKAIGTDDEELETITFSRYSKVSKGSAGIDTNYQDDKVAVIYTSGAIMPDLGSTPFGGSQMITADDVQEQIEDALDDSKVKAIVVHINSPGGSATTSDLIWNTLKKASEKKPVIASMGSVAASGGYYMAMGADTVVAGPNTITGSIGIFSVLFNTNELLEDKIGLDFETLTTHEYADLYDLTDAFTPAEERILQQNTENGYETFLSRVAENRGMTRDEVHELAQGRVYTGTAAHEVGLVDVVGDIETAIALAAEMSEMESWRIEIYPKPKGLYEALFNTANTQAQMLLRGWIPEMARQPIEQVSLYQHGSNVQSWAIMPLRYEIN
ncbi:signal peptide peptidase SppA [Gracilimonas mengyeensis]|uniref:Signal peptide peptidase A. Serine peptidase. MEROPS family S49 n=1 Tax=Gracilimonas mengyeensis TaxID=1302730 RepID=A0A521E9S4_9BACT|nr:signal peptide peptidase SppA [Gracilimonas mengyeensis]SMO80687.1 signal peptide peptidase A. Serine peptidase. MEROPS family S49 [Gracilimonas mengyeensis]